MKAAFVYGPRDLKVEEADIPRVGDDGVLVRVRTCGVCFSDVRFCLGLRKYAQTAFGKGAPALLAMNGLERWSRSGGMLRISQLGIGLFQA